MSEEFTGFLRKFLKPGDHFVLEPDKCFRKARYRYDPRRVFENFTEKLGRGDVFYHAMRHSFISNLCNSGNHTITEVVAWSGDTVEVIEKNYWHKTTRTGGFDATMKGQRSGDDTKAQLAEILTLMKSGRQHEAEERLRELMPDEDILRSSLTAIPDHEPKFDANGRITEMERVQSSIGSNKE